MSDPNLTPLGPTPFAEVAKHPDELDRLAGQFRERARKMAEEGIECPANMERLLNIANCIVEKVENRGNPPTISEEHGLVTEEDIEKAAEATKKAMDAALEKRIKEQIAEKTAQVLVLPNEMLPGILAIFELGGRMANRGYLTLGNLRDTFRKAGLMRPAKGVSRCTTRKKKPAKNSRGASSRSGSKRRSRSR